MIREYKINRRIPTYSLLYGSTGEREQKSERKTKYRNQPQYATIDRKSGHELPKKGTNT